MGRLHCDTCAHVRGCRRARMGGGALSAGEYGVQGQPGPCNLRPAFVQCAVRAWAAPPLGRPGQARRCFATPTHPLSQPLPVVRLTGMDDTSSRHAASIPASERVWQHFLDLIATLPADARALLLHDALGLQVEDIAPLLHLSVAECRSRLAFARTCLNAHPHPTEPDHS